MRKNNRRDNIRKERIIMIASSALVLAALTMTGLYMRGQEAKQLDDGYTLDFTALENDAGNNLGAIGREQANNTTTGKNTPINLEDDLDYMPMEEDLVAEAGSHLVELPGLSKEAEDTPNQTGNTSQKTAVEEKERAENTENAENEQSTGNPDDIEATQNMVELHYNEDQRLIVPVNGGILIPYSMDSGTYFTTLDQYKYNPATVFSAAEGAEVRACAEGRITNVYKDAELGNAVTIELGDGYVATYGQLTDIQVEIGDYVEASEKIGTVAAPTMYYTLEGTNLYFRLEKDGAPVNSEKLY